MPVIHIEHPSPHAPVGLLQAVCEKVRSILDLPPSHAWSFWVPVDRKNVFRPDWDDRGDTAGPCVWIRCRSSYTFQQRRTVILGVAEVISEFMSLPIDSIFIVLDPVERGRVMARGDIWGSE